MAFQTYDRIREVSVTAGTGNLVLSAYNDSYNRFSDVYDANVRFPYCVVEGAASFETGIGYLNGSGELVRESVLESSSVSSGPLFARVTFTSASKDIFVPSPARLTGTLNSGPSDNYDDTRFLARHQPSGSSFYEWALVPVEGASLNSGSFVQDGVVYVNNGKLSTSPMFKFNSGSGFVQLDANLNVSHNIQANSKEFYTDHPYKPGYKLRHGSLEGPEHGMYMRQRVEMDRQTAIVDVPLYFSQMADMWSCTVLVSAEDGSKVSYSLQEYVGPSGLSTWTVAMRRRWSLWRRKTTVDVIVIAARTDVAFVLEEGPTGPTKDAGTLCDF